MSSTFSSFGMGSGSDSSSHSFDKESGRQNLLLLTRLVLRGLLEYCMKKQNRFLSNEEQSLTDLFIMIEKVLKHGFRGGSKSFMSLTKTADQELWSMIQTLGKESKEAEEAVACVQQLANVHSSISRVRAWLRLALMQKKLADYFMLLVEAKLILNEYYEDWAILKHESTGIAFAGSLIALRVIDCNLYLKEDDLNAQGVSVNLEQYIKMPSIPTVEDMDEEEAAGKEESHIKSILDQKNYIEESNRKLVSEVSYLQRRLALLEAMRRHRTAAVDGILKEDELMKDKSTEEDLETLEIRRSEELGTAMELLEKDVHEKQDTIISLRQQIDDVKKLNIDLYHKLRGAEESSKQKDKLITKLETSVVKESNEKTTKIEQMQAKMGELEKEVRKSQDLVGNLKVEISTKNKLCNEVQNQLADRAKENEILDESRSAEKLVREDLQSRVNALESVEKECFSLRDYCIKLETTIKDYETSLEEMGVSLSQSKLKVEDLKEGIVPLTDAQWQSDKDNVSCKQCEQKFSVARRRHHCRNCGGIYCGLCSEQTLPLPSSSKPVRVCDNCYQSLLQRLSSKLPAS